MRIRTCIEISFFNSRLLDLEGEGTASVTVYRSTRRNVSGDVNFNHPCCEKPKYCVVILRWVWSVLMVHGMLTVVHPVVRRDLKYAVKDSNRQQK